MKQAETAKTALLRAAYAAFNRREMNTALAMMTPDMDWPNGMEGGRVYGRDQVRDYWTRQWSAINPHVEPIDIQEQADGRAVVRVRQIVRDLSGAVILDQIVNHAYQFREGMIARMDIQVPDSEQQDFKSV